MISLGVMCFFIYLLSLAVFFISCTQTNVPTSTAISTFPMPLTKSTVPEMQNPGFDTNQTPTLLELIDYALKNNPQTKIAYLNALAANSDVKSKKSSYFPNINLNGQFLRVRQTDFPATGRFWESSWGPYLQLTYTLLDFGNRHYQVKEAIAQLNSLNYLHAEAIQQVIQTVRDDYFELIAQKELTLSAQANLENALANLEVAKAKYFLGVVDFLDLSQAKSNYLQNKADLINQKHAQEKAFYTLTNDLGNPTQISFQIGLFDSLPSEITFRKASHFIAIAERMNPHIQSLVEQTKLARHAIKSTKAKSWPLITTQLQLGRTYYNKGVHDDYNFALQFNFTLPLYTGGSLKSAAEKAKINLKIAEENLQKARNNLTCNILILQNQLKTTYELLDLAAEALKAAKEQYEVAFSKYKAGTIDILILINAQTNLAAAKASFINAQKSWHVTVTDIALQLGILTSSPISKDILFKQGKDS